MHILWCFFYHVKSVPHLRIVGCVFADLYTLIDDSECPWTLSFLYYPKCFPGSSVIKIRQPSVNMYNVHQIDLDGLI